MPGVLVDNQTFPLPFRPRPRLSHLLSTSSDDPPPFDSPPSSLVASNCSLLPCSSSPCSPHRIPSFQSPLQFFYSPPLSPSSDLSSPSLVSVDGIEESGLKGFPRSFSNLGGKGFIDGFDVGPRESLEDADRCSTESLGALVGGAGNYCSSVSGGSTMGSPVFPDGISALQKFLPSNSDDDEIWPVDNSWPAMDVYSCDDFRMYEFKVRKCMRGRSHDWTECPFAHPGEKARRRDPRRYHYSGTACPEFRKGSCRRGDSCEYAHGVFECWLHPGRYRTQPCKDGRNCRRRVCFFAHTVGQLRVLPGVGEGGGAPKARAAAASPPATPGRSSLLKAAINGGSYDGSPLRQALAAGTLEAAMALELVYDNNTSSSQPASSIAELLSTLQQLQLKPGTLESPAHMQQASPPWSPKLSLPHRPARSLPATPAKRPFPCHSDQWDADEHNQHPSSQRIESADLRAKIYENNCCLENDAPDFAWVNELVK